MAIMTAIAAAAPIVGGLMGSAAASKDRKKAREAMERAYRELKNLGLPPDLSEKLILREYAKVGEITPEVEEDIFLAQSAVSDIEEDPSLRKAQEEVIRMIGERGTVGMTAEERAMRNEMLNRVNREQQAKQQQILNELASRGQAGSGQELAAKLQATQAGANLASQEADRISAMAGQRALQALGQKGQLSGQLRSQDFDVNMARAKAEDERNKFLFQNAAGRQQRNIDRLNAAQMANLENKQRIANANIDLYNKELQRQQAEKGNYWDRKFGKAKAMAGQETDMAGYYQGQGDRTAGQYAQIGGGIGTGLSSYMDYLNKSEDRDLKRRELDIKEKELGKA